MQKENDTAKKKVKGGPLKLNTHPKDLFDENPYRSDKRRFGLNVYTYLHTNMSSLSALIWHLHISHFFRDFIRLTVLSPFLLSSLLFLSLPSLPLTPQLVRNVLTVDFHLTKYRTIVQDLQKEASY